MRDLVRDFRAQIIWFSSGLQRLKRVSFGSVQDFRAQSANHMVQFGTSEQLCVERESYGTVRDFREQSANHLIHFGTSERRAQIANHLIQFGTSECRARIIWFNSRLQSAIHFIQFGTSERDSCDSVRDFRARLI